MKIIMSKTLAKSLVSRVAKVADKGDIGFHIDDKILTVQTLISNDSASTASLDAPVICRYQIKKEDEHLSVKGYSEETTFGVSAKMMHRSISLVNGDVITLDIKKTQVSIYGKNKQNKSNLPLLILTGSKLPAINEGMENIVCFGFEAQKFENFSLPLMKTMVAASKKGNKPVLTGLAIMLNETSNSVSCLATNAHRLHEKKLPLNFDTISVQKEPGEKPVPLAELADEERESILKKIYVVSPAGIKAATSFFSGDDVVIMSISDSFCKFSGSDTLVVAELFMRNMVDRYPENAREIPKNALKNANNKVVFQKNVIKGELSNAVSFASTGKISSETLLHFKKNSNEVGLEVKVKGDSSCYQSQIIFEEDVTDISSIEEEMTISLDPSYLNELVDIFHSEKVMISFDNPNKPIVVQDMELTEPAGSLTPIRMK